MASFNPTAPYQVVLDVDLTVFAFQNGVYFDKYGNQFTSLPASKNGYVAPSAAGQTSLTVSSAAPGTVRAVIGDMHVSATGMTSGNLVGVRGAVTIPNGQTVNGASYLYGTQGKIISGTGTIDVGSGHVAGVYGQLDFTGGTITSGHVAAVIADIFNPSSNGAMVDGIYVEQVTGTLINSVIKAVCAATYFLDIEDYGGAHYDHAATAVAANPNGVLKIKTAQGVCYIPTYASFT